jgi:hypothetical protein
MPAAAQSSCIVNATDLEILVLGFGLCRNEEQILLQGKKFVFSRQG